MNCESPSARRSRRSAFGGLFLGLVAGLFGPSAAGAEKPVSQVGTFSVDVTIPLNHRCMGVLPTKSQSIGDPLYAKGFVLLGADAPIVYVAVDWCEIRNGAYDQWREALAAAAGTTRERVLVSSLHQHDAPVTDLGAARLLETVGLRGELYDETFHDRTVARVAEALRESLNLLQPVTHLGLGQAEVRQVASNRRIVREGRPPDFSRGSRSGESAFDAAAPEGEIDPFLKTLSFWDNDRPLLALSVYATHPMSYYGQGDVSSDFVGLARQKRQDEDPEVFQIYASGCSGDVTAGKYNDGSPADRLKLIDRMTQGMRDAWKNTRRVPLETITFRNTPLDIEYSPDADLTHESLREQLESDQLRIEDRILAAMGLSSRLRVAAGQTIDFPCIDFGAAQIVLFPGESFVGYQLMAQKMRPDSFVVAIGYGECWPGYIPTDAAFGDNFQDKWLWTAPGAEARIRAALERVLGPVH
ncbi:MAG: hypothetical protein AB7Q45_05510 [Planctomycetaceae bacterium]